MKPIKPRSGMYQEQFHLLQTGDVVMMTRSGVHRKVLRASGKDGKTHFIELKKLVPSWTSSPNTIYTCNEAGMFRPVKCKHMRKILKYDYSKLIRERKKNFIDYHKKQAAFHLSKLKQFA